MSVNFLNNKILDMFLVILLFFSLLNVPLSRAGETNLYDFNWLDPDKIVYVLQNKVFEKENTFYMNVGYGQSLSADFQSAQNLQLKTGFFFAEEWGLELLYSKISNSNNETYKNISVSGDTVPFIRRFDSYYGGLIIFSPFYAKINTFNKIFYFDLNFGVGYASLQGESNKEAFRRADGTNTFASETYAAFMYKIALRFYISKNFNLNIDILKYLYKVEKAIDPTTKIYASETDLIVAIGFSI